MFCIFICIRRHYYTPKHKVYNNLLDYLLFPLKSFNNIYVFIYLLEASIVLVSSKAFWADSLGHNMLAMTNNQTFEPCSCIYWNYARLAMGDALKFSDFRIIMLGSDWCTHRLMESIKAKINGINQS